MADDERWWRFDPRVDWLIDTLKMLKRTKVLVICAHAETAMDLEDALRVRSGIPASVFHEGMSILERDRAAAYFADEEFGAQVLICSEIGSEGRNFQFAHHLVMFDLPAHPDLLEQRIGRLDRIGQKHTIQLHIPYLQDSPQERLFQWYHQGLNAFLNTCPTGNALQHQFGPRLLPLLEGGESKAWEALVADARSERERLEAELHTGRDRLLELNSGGGGEGQALVEAILEQDDQFALPIYMETLFDAFGIDSEDHSENALILKPSEKMLDASFPLGDDEGVTITYDRGQALSREDMQFLTWEHPMVQGGMDLVLSGSMGNTAVALIKNKALKPGTVLLELLFVSEVVAPRSLQLGRYLPPAALRCLLDANGNDLASRVAFETLNDQLESVPRASANKFVQAQRDVLAKRISSGEAKVLPAHVERVAEASAAWRRKLMKSWPAWLHCKRSTRACATARSRRCASSVKRAWRCWKSGPAPGSHPRAGGRLACQVALRRCGTAAAGAAAATSGVVNPCCGKVRPGSPDLFQVALACMQAHQLCGQATEWRRRALLAGQLHRAIKILEQRAHVPFDRFEAALGHLRREDLQRPGIGKATSQCFGDQGRIHPRLLSQRHHFGDDQGIARHDHLVAGLGYLPCPHRAHVRHALAKHLQHRARALQVRRCATDHDRQGTGFGTRCAA